MADYHFLEDTGSVPCETLSSLVDLKEEKQLWLNVIHYS